MSLATELKSVDVGDLEIERLEIADGLQDFTIDRLGVGDPNLMPYAVSCTSCETSACNECGGGGGEGDFPTA